MKPVSTRKTMATKFRDRYRIESTRLKNYDYSQNGAYFITICTNKRVNFLGEIIDSKLSETKQSKICIECWNDLSNHYPNCILDEFIVMPNHVHGIVIIDNFKINIQPNDNQKNHSVSEIIRAFKPFSSRRINEYQNTYGLSIWQSRFHDHIIRDEESLNKIRQYIINNPSNWAPDELFAELPTTLP